jgi:hypothetical protein
MTHLPKNNPPSVEELVLEPTVRALLQLLVTDVICITAHHAHHVLREAGVLGARAGRFHKNARRDFYLLEKAKYIRSIPVKCLPLPTIGAAPIFRLEKYDSSRSTRRTRHSEFETQSLIPLESILLQFQKKLGDGSADFRRLPPAIISETPIFEFKEAETGWVPLTPETLAAFAFGAGPVHHLNESHPTVADLTCYASLAKRRVPPLEAHRGAKLYFATNKAASLFPPDKHCRLDIEQTAEQLIGWHRAVETSAGASAQDIAGTQLTAILNLNQFMLANQFRSKFAANEWRYEALGRGHATSPDGTLSVKDRGNVALFFLRPLLPDEVREIIQTWWSTTSPFSECWWI